MAADKDQKKIHAWASIGYSFKSPLVFYDVPSITRITVALLLTDFV